ncbi:MAG: putative toxin [Bacillota bacterium]|nr:putative toxin [Bacillota bacterium]
MERVLEYIRHPENHEAFRTSFGNRIPDIISGNFVGEIKNVAYLTLTKQMKGIMEIARRSSNKMFILIVNKGTIISKPLMSEVKRIGGKIVKLGSNDLFAAFSFMPWQVIEKLINYDPRTGRFRDEESLR